MTEMHKDERLQLQAARLCIVERAAAGSSARECIMIIIIRLLEQKHEVSDVLLAQD